MILHDGIDERVNRELIAHTSTDILSKSIRIKNRFLHIWEYPSLKAINVVIDRNLKTVEGKEVLDYGCGHGCLSLDLLSRGANVCGIDISPVHITEAKQLAIEKGYSESQYSFFEMDAHSLQFADNTFDMVIGKGILHHLDLLIALSEIYRVLKTGGRVIMMEPLADNPLLKLFRLLTPFARTLDECPLSKKDLFRIAKGHRWKLEFSYCGILEAPTAMFTSLFLPNTPNNWLLKCADKLETWIHEHDLLSSWNQYILLNLIKE